MAGCLIRAYYVNHFIVIKPLRTAYRGRSERFFCYGPYDALCKSALTVLYSLTTP